VLGIGARHLTRLFMQHLGAPPSTLARTRRVQIAKKLLDETAITITEIAFIAGFSSLRRFNTVFRETDGRPPSQIKRTSRGKSLNSVVRRAQGLRLPGAWDGFEVAVRVLVTRDVGHVSTAAVMDVWPAPRRFRRQSLDSTFPDGGHRAVA
jgi:Helix-turn-helix domain